MSWIRTLSWSGRCRSIRILRKIKKREIGDIISNTSPENLLPGTRNRTFCWRDCGDFPSLVAQMVKHLPTMQETWVQSLGWEDPLEKGMATYSSILAWKIPWMEEPGRLQSMGSQRVRHDWVTSLTHLNTKEKEREASFGRLPGKSIVNKDGCYADLKMEKATNLSFRGLTMTLS